MADRKLHSLEYLRQRIACDPTRGALTWLSRPVSDFPSARIANAWNSRCADKPAFNIRAAHGYLVGSMGGVRYYAHRLIWLFAHGVWPDHIDHFNGDGWDNRLENLRSCSRSENQRNMKMHKRNKSGFNGVRWSHTKWEAQVGGISYGRFDTIEEAAAVRAEKQLLLGYTAHHGQPREVRRDAA